MSAAPVKRCPPVGCGRVFRAAEGLTLAASPVFGLIALLTLYYDNAGASLCGTASGVPWNGMATMYLLMSAAHLPPWLKLLLPRRGGNGRTSPQIQAV
jgi:hypothetical protein